MSNVTLALLSPVIYHLLIKRLSLNLVMIQVVRMTGMVVNITIGMLTMINDDDKKGHWGGFGFVKTIC